MIMTRQKKIYSYSDELKCLEFGCKLYKIYRMFLIHSCFFIIIIYFYLAVSVNPCKPTLACLFREKCSGEMTKKKKKMNNVWRTNTVQTGSNGSHIGNWFSLAIHSQLLISFILIKYRICASFFWNGLNAGRGISEPKTKVIYVKLWISCAK